MSDDHQPPEPFDGQPPEEPEAHREPEPSGENVLAGALALIAEAEAALHDVERALERLEAGSYATCEICGAPIDPDLLSSAPTERRCGAHRV